MNELTPSHPTNFQLDWHCSKWLRQINWFLSIYHAIDQERRVLAFQIHSVIVNFDGVKGA